MLRRCDVDTVYVGGRAGRGGGKRLPTECFGIVTRTYWRSRRTRGSPIKLEHPVPLVFMHDTQTEQCEKSSWCKKVIRWIQGIHMYHNGIDVLFFLETFHMHAQPITDISNMLVVMGLHQYAQ